MLLRVFNRFTLSNDALIMEMQLHRKIMVVMIRNLMNESVLKDLGKYDNATFLDELLSYLQSNSKETIMIVQNKIFISILSGKKQ